MKKFRIYMSSTTYKWWNLKSFMWKKNYRECFLKLKQHSKLKRQKIEFFDPLKFASEDPKVCPLDIKDINASDFVVVYIDKLSIGTLLELGYCLFKANKMFCVLTFRKSVYYHPWIQYLCKDKLFDNMDKCIEYSIKSLERLIPMKCTCRIQKESVTCQDKKR